MTVEERMRLHFEAEEFLIREADLLDQQRYADWLGTLTPDILYWAPAVESVEFQRTTLNYVSAESETCFFYETLATLQRRVSRLQVGGAWAEIPPSRTKHFISNVMIDGIENGEIFVKSNFFLFRSRLEAEEDTYYGAREDRLRRTDGTLKLAKRKIILAQAVLKSRSITTFF